MVGQHRPERKGWRSEVVSIIGSKVGCPLFRSLFRSFPLCESRHRERDPRSTIYFLAPVARRAEMACTVFEAGKTSVLREITAS